METGYSIGDFVIGLSNIVSPNALLMICAKRGINPSTPLESLDEKGIDLLEAEVYYYLSGLPANSGNRQDTDGDWSHSESGMQVSENNIAEWRKRYVALRKKWGLGVLGGNNIKILNL